MALCEVALSDGSDLLAEEIKFGLGWDGILHPLHNAFLKGSQKSNLRSKSKLSFKKFISRSPELKKLGKLCARERVRERVDWIEK